MTPDVPEKFVPDESVKIAEEAECPGCKIPLGRGMAKLLTVRHEKEVWCRRCAFEDSEDVVRAEKGRFCPSCLALTPYRCAAAPEAALCFVCGTRFRSEEAVGGDGE